jgi:O-antigen ligase
VRDLLAYASVVQGALLVGLTLVLIQPASIPDPLNVGPALSWTALCMIAGAPALALAARRQLPGTRLDPFVWIYLACSAALLPLSHDKVVSSTWLLAMAANIVIFYGVVAATRVSPAMPAVILVAVALGVAVLQIIALEYHLERGLTELTRAYERPEGWNGYPELGLLACIQLAVLIAVMQSTPRLSSRLAVFIVIGVTVFELTFLYSRMAWFTAIGLFLVAPIAARSKSIRWQWGFAAAGAAIALTIAIGRTDAGRMIRTRITEPSTVSGRLDIWRRTARMVQDHPLSGVGMGNFEAVYEPVYNPMLNPDGRRGGHAHNLWLQVAAEQGLPIAVAYVSLWVAVLTLGWHQRHGSWTQRAALLIVVVVAVRSLGDYMFFSTGGAPARLHTLLWMTWGMIAAEPVPVVKPR